MRHRCHVHGPAIGHPAPQISPRVLFADLPEKRVCPNCAAPPSKFTRLGDDRRAHRNCQARPGAGAGRTGRGLLSTHPRDRHDRRPDLQSGA
ncbi:rubredoxin [Sinorhizobium fredii]|uniref:rubredoxin n=1 Tax=Rhizobium fredii TaxID=380 RepID=UPI003076A948